MRFIAFIFLVSSFAFANPSTVHIEQSGSGRLCSTDTDYMTYKQCMRASCAEAKAEVLERAKFVCDSISGKLGEILSPLVFSGDFVSNQHVCYLTKSVIACHVD